MTNQPTPSKTTNRSLKHAAAGTHDPLAGIRSIIICGVLCGISCTGLAASDVSKPVEQAFQQTFVLAAPTHGITTLAPRNQVSATKSRPHWAVPLHRVFRTDTQSHLFTALHSEVEAVLSGASGGVWVSEGISHYVSMQEIKGGLPVYRLYNRWTGTHFYTISEEELSSIFANLSDRWEFEGTAFYAMNRPATGTVPVYRFYFWESRSHFFTTSKAERDLIIANNPSAHDEVGYPVRYEGIAWYAWQ